MTQQALLVIDVQVDNIRPDGPYPFSQSDVTYLIQRVNKLTHLAESTNTPVFFIRQVYKGFLGTLISKLLLKGVTLKGQPGAELDPRLALRHGTVLDKSSQNAFKGTDLQAQLAELSVEKLLITGLDGVYCVNATAKAALAQGYEITLLSDAIITTKPDAWAKLNDQLQQLGASAETTEALINSPPS